MKVNSKPILRTLTLRTLKAAKTRNRIAVAAIALTAVLFTAVFTIGGHMLGAIQAQTMRQVGTKAHGGLKGLTWEDYETFKQSPLIRDISYSIPIARTENAALNKLNCEIRYGEDKHAAWNFSEPTVGAMPGKAGEIACDTDVLAALGVQPQLGATVPLEFSVNDKKYAEHFTLAGYWPGDNAAPARKAWLSRKDADKILAENQLGNESGFGKIFADTWFASSWNIAGKMAELTAGTGVEYGVNWAYAASDVDPLMAMTAGFVLGLILLSGALIIYSIFAISVVADIKFYGLLKTIGATGRQIKGIVLRQAFALCLVGIPIGLLLGYGCGLLLAPMMLVLLTVADPAPFGANPLIFVFAALFSLATVLISCRKPAKIAAEVPPAEAVKYGEVAGKRKTKRTRKVTALTMALVNVTRGKGKLAVVVLSLSLSLILLNAIVSATESFDLDAFVSRSIVGDFAVADFRLFRSSPGTAVFDGVDPAILTKAAESGGTQSNIYYHGTPAAQVYGIDERLLRTFAATDYGKLRSGNYAVLSRSVIAVGESPAVVPKAGDTITLTDGDGVTRAFEVIELVDEYPHSLSARMRFGNSLDVVVAEEVFRGLYGEAQPLQTNIFSENAQDFEPWLKAYTATVNPNMDFMSRATLKAEFDGLQRTYTALGGGLSGILALIGVLNFINTAAASILSRRREFAMLQSVGMTGRQLRKTLFLEGVTYTVLTAAFTLTAGLGAGQLITRLIAGQVWFFKARFTPLPSVLCLPLLLAICAAAPILCYARLNRAGVAERLRME
jgi:putative ABC transport system permease protein